MGEFTGHEVHEDIAPKALQLLTAFYSLKYLNNIFKLTEIATCTDS
jgi:hypothetical protein